MSQRKPVTATEVREWARQQPEYADQPSVQPKARGRLPKVIRDAYRKANKSRDYAEGNASTVPLHFPAVDSRGRSITKTAQVTPAQLRSLSGVSGKRGRISAEGLVAAGQAYAASLNTPTAE